LSWGKGVTSESFHGCTALFPNQSLDRQTSIPNKSVLLQPQVRDKPCTVADIRIEEVTRGGSEDRPAPLRLKREILDRELDRVYEAKTLKGEVGTWGVGRGLDLLEGSEGPPVCGGGQTVPTMPASEILDRELDWVCEAKTLEGNPECLALYDRP
jgi:hypothetical protein